MQKINVNILQKPKTIQTSVKNITPINPAKGTKTILQNGIHNIKEFEFISVNVKPDKLQEKEIEIISNGKYEVTPDDEYFLTKVKVDVNVPIPDGYIIPEGTLEIKDNGTFDVRQFEYVLINVPTPEGYLKPEGKIDITNTQEIDVTQYAKVQVVDENLKAGNIAEGVEVLGIIGTHKGGEEAQDLLPVEQYYIDSLKTLDFESIIPKKEYLTNENTTLYTPNNFKYYYIVKKNNTMFRILWTNEEYVIHRDGTGINILYSLFDVSLASCRFNLSDIIKKGKNAIPYQTYNNATLEEYSRQSVGFDSGSVKYYDCYSIEDCLSAIKNKNTIYSGITGYNLYMTAAIYEANTPVIYSNAYSMGTDGKINAICKQISSNETIVSIE